MTHYNRVSGIRWPVTFHVEDGRHFEIPAPVADALLLRVDGVEHAMGETRGEGTEGAVIGRAIGWWIARTGKLVVITPPGRLE